MVQRIYLPKGIDENAFQGLRLCPDTPVHIKLDTLGGNLAATERLLHALRGQIAPVHGYISKHCCSAGALVAAACDEVYMRAGSCMLIHMVRDVPEHMAANASNLGVEDWVVICQANVAREDIDIKRRLKDMVGYVEHSGVLNYLVGEEVDDFLIDGVDVVKHSCRMDGLYNVKVVG